MAIPHNLTAAIARRCIVALLGTLLLSTAAQAQPTLTPYTAEYKVRVSVLGGELSTELRATNGGYIATHMIRPTGMSRIISRGTLIETSEFYDAPDGVRPRAYSSRDTISREKTDVSIRFDWETGEARGTVNGEDVVSVMDTLAHDRVSIQYELMHDLLNGGPSPEYTMFEIDRLRTVNVRMIGTRTVKVPAGKFEVVGIRHQAEGSKRETTLWCARELGYLPVVIEQYRKGKLRVRATLRRYRQNADTNTVRLEQ